MSSEEDFSIVSEVQQPSEVSLRDVMKSINEYKKKYEQLLQEQQEVAASREDQRKMADEYRRRTEMLKQKVEQEQSSNKEKLQIDKDRLKLLLQEEAELLREVQTLEGALKEEEAQIEHLKQQTKVFAAAPDRQVYFAGSTAKADNRPTFDMGSRIVYMMEGGTALISFEEDVVARKILELKEHQVDLGSECRITVEAQPVQLMIPKLVEVDTQVCSRHILISNLPKMDVETLLNKLEIHFSKKRNGGGEVDSCEMMADTWTVVIAFVDPDVAEGLTLTEFHNVQLQQKAHRVRVTPFLNGNIANLEAEMVVCPRTVLLTGIPDVMEQETLQDLLEIHFQKSTNGGGEIDACVYNPVGHQTSAVFEGGAESSTSELQPSASRKNTI